MAKIKLAFPIAEAHGYLDRGTDENGKPFGGFGVTCTKYGAQVSFNRKRKRNTTLKPLSSGELAQQSLFTTRSKNVARRLSKLSDTYVQDAAAFAAQKDLPNGIKSFQKWLWADEKKKG